MAMAVSRKMLVEGEEVVASMRTHIKALFLPFLVLVASAGLGAFLAAVARDNAGDLAMWVVIAVAALIAVVFAIIPFLRWYFHTFTITNRRFIQQEGILTRTGNITPLSRVNNLSFERELVDRILRCGTLFIHDASEREPTVVHDVPRVQDVHRLLTTLVFEHYDDRRGEDLA